MPNDVATEKLFSKIDALTDSVNASQIQQATIAADTKATRENTHRINGRIDHFEERFVKHEELDRKEFSAIKKEVGGVTNRVWFYAGGLCLLAVLVSSLAPIVARALAR